MAKRKVARKRPRKRVSRAKKKASRPRVIRVLKQTGKRKSKAADKKRKALAPGKRKSKSGRTYWETRKNRSDAGRSRL